MYVFSSVFDHAGRNIRGCFVLILLYVRILKANSTSGNSTFQEKQFKSTDQPYSEADSQIPKSQAKCCYPNEWLLYSSLELQCVEIPPNIENLSLKSEWFQTFSKLGILTEPSCSMSDQTEIWNISNAKDYHYYPEKKKVFNLVTKRYFRVLCSDYINLQYHYSKKGNYTNETFEELENKVSQTFLCSIPEEGTLEEIKNFLSLYGMGTSNIFLVITFYLYVSTPKLRRKVYDICFLCQLATFIIAFSFTIWRHQLHKEDGLATYSTFVGYMNQYWLLSAFSWLTILCIDLWCAITAQKCLFSDTKKLIIYCLCGWGIPLSMSFATFCASQLENESHFKVDFCRGYGWFQLNYETSFLKRPDFIYFYSYLSLTLMINLCLFIHISVIIINNDYGWKNAENSRKHEANKKRFCIYLKLFLVMGLTWLLEVISYYLDDVSNGWFSLVMDLQGNILQGIFIFVVSVCNTRVRPLLKERFFSNQKDYRMSSSVFSRKSNLERTLCSKDSSISLKLMKPQN